MGHTVQSAVCPFGTSGGMAAGMAKGIPDPSRRTSNKSPDTYDVTISACTMTAQADSKAYGVTTIVVGYALASSLLAVINKYAITHFNFPALLTALQYATSVTGVWLFGRLGFLSHDPFVWTNAKKFFPAALIFYLAIFTNTYLLKHANVDTFIVFRSSTPLFVAIADTVFRKQPWPSKYTFFSLMVIFGGAVGYVITDSSFTLTAYSWAFAYLIVITTDMVYIKHIVTHVGLNTWGLVYYNNLMSLMMAPLFWILTGEYAEVFETASKPGSWSNWEAIFSVSLSCVFGLAISFFGFSARRAISATGFTVTGVVNKFLTVIINMLIWDKHASTVGLVCLCFTIVGGVLYQQSTTKSPLTSQTQAEPRLLNKDEDKEIVLDTASRDLGGKGETHASSGDEENGLSQKRLT